MDTSSDYQRAVNRTGSRPYWLIALWIALLMWYSWATALFSIPLRSASGFYLVWLVLSVILWIVSSFWLWGTVPARVIDVLFAGSLAVLVGFVAMSQDHVLVTQHGHTHGTESVLLLCLFALVPWVVTGRVIFLLYAVHDPKEAARR